jgi:hypothetical protein
LLAELGCSSATLHRVIHLPVDTVAFRQVVEETINRRHIADEYGRLSREVEVAERELVRIEEERRRLAEENLALQNQDGQGYAILQEVVGELPWPVLGIDDEGMLALINASAVRCFADPRLIPGSLLAELLPALAALVDQEPARIKGRDYICHRRDIRLGRSVTGHLLMLEEVRA